MRIRAGKQTAVESVPARIRAGKQTAVESVPAVSISNLMWIYRAAMEGFIILKYTTQSYTVIKISQYIRYLVFIRSIKSWELLYYINLRVNWF